MEGPVEDGTTVSSCLYIFHLKMVRALLLPVAAALNAKLALVCTVVICTPQHVEVGLQAEVLCALDG